MINIVEHAITYSITANWLNDAISTSVDTHSIVVGYDSAYTEGCITADDIVFTPNEPHVTYTVNNGNSIFCKFIDNIDTEDEKCTDIECENGGSLDEFIDTFDVVKNNLHKETTEKNEC